MNLPRISMQHTLMEIRENVPLHFLTGAFRVSTGGIF